MYCMRFKSHVYELFTWVCVGVGADGGPVNRSGDGGMCYPNMPICLPCWPGCKSCQDGTPCWVQEAWLLRASVLAIQGVFMFLIFVSMMVAYRHRRNRVSQAFWLNVWLNVFDAYEPKFVMLCFLMTDVTKKGNLIMVVPCEKKKNAIN